MSDDPLPPPLPSLRRTHCRAAASIAIAALIGILGFIAGFVYREIPKTIAPALAGRSKKIASQQPASARQTLARVIKTHYTATRYWITVENVGDKPISKITFALRVVQEGRAVPHYESTLPLSIPGGLNPGETKEWELAWPWTPTDFAEQVLMDRHGVSILPDEGNGKLIAEVQEAMIFK